MIQDLWDTGKEVLRGKYIAIKWISRKKKRKMLNKQPNLTLKRIRKIY